MVAPNKTTFDCFPNQCVIPSVRFLCPQTGFSAGFPHSYRKYYVHNPLALDFNLFDIFVKYHKHSFNFPFKIP